MPGDLGGLHGRVPVAGTVVYRLGFCWIWFFRSWRILLGLGLVGDACPGSLRTGSCAVCLLWPHLHTTRPCVGGSLIELLAEDWLAGRSSRDSVSGLWCFSQSMSRGYPTWPVVGLSHPQDPNLCLEAKGPHPVGSGSRQSMLVA